MFSDDTCEKIYLCPSTPKNSCHWEGAASDILEHFHESHKDLLMDSNTIKADVTQDSEQNRIMASGKGLFLVQTKVCVETAKLLIRLRFLRFGSMKSFSKISYGVEVASGKFGFANEQSSDGYSPVCNADYGIEVDFQAISLMSSVNGIDFVTVNINIVEEVVEEVSEEHVDTIVLDEMESDKELDNEEAVDYHIISSKENSVISDGDCETDEQNSSHENDELEETSYSEYLHHTNKSELNNIEESCEEEEEENFSEVNIKCTNCDTCMIPPIYMCSDGHSVCYECKQRACKTCGQTITNLRNFDLEEHSKAIDYSCRYESYGCSKKCKYNQIRKHEINCEYCFYKCELCSFGGKFVDMKSHFRVAHPSTKIYEGMTDIHFPRGSNFAIININGVFYCTSRVTETYVEWQVVYCGPKERYFSCEVNVTGKKQYHQPQHHVLKRYKNTFRWTVPFEALKKANVKEKNAKLTISLY